MDTPQMSDLFLEPVRQVLSNAQLSFSFDIDHCKNDAGTILSELRNMAANHRITPTTTVWDQINWLVALVTHLAKLRTLTMQEYRISECQLLHADARNKELQAQLLAANNDSQEARRAADERHFATQREAFGLQDTISRLELQRFRLNSEVSDLQFRCEIAESDTALKIKQLDLAWQGISDLTAELGLVQNQKTDLRAELARVQHQRVVELRKVRLATHTKMWESDDSQEDSIFLRTLDSVRSLIDERDELADDFNKLTDDLIEERKETAKTLGAKQEVIDQLEEKLAAFERGSFQLEMDNIEPDRSFVPSASRTSLETLDLPTVEMVPQSETASETLSPDTVTPPVSAPPLGACLPATPLLDPGIPNVRIATVTPVTHGEPSVLWSCPSPPCGTAPTAEVSSPADHLETNLSLIGLVSFDTPLQLARPPTYGGIQPVSKHKRLSPLTHREPSPCKRMRTAFWETSRPILSETTGCSSSRNRDHRRQVPMARSQSPHRDSLLDTTQTGAAQSFLGGNSDPHFTGERSKTKSTWAQQKVSDLGIVFSFLAHPVADTHQGRRVKFKKRKGCRKKRKKPLLDDIDFSGSKPTSPLVGQVPVDLLPSRNYAASTTTLPGVSTSMVSRLTAHQSSMGRIHPDICDMSTVYDSSQAQATITASADVSLDHTVQTPRQNAHSACVIGIAPPTLVNSLTVTPVPATDTGPNTCLSSVRQHGIPLAFCELVEQSIVSMFDPMVPTEPVVAQCTTIPAITSTKPIPRVAVGYMGGPSLCVHRLCFLLCLLRCLIISSHPLHLGHTLLALPCRLVPLANYLT